MMELSITEHIPAIRNLNNIYVNIIAEGEISYPQQVFITEYYNSYKNFEAVENMILRLFMNTDKDKFELLLSILEDEVLRNLYLYHIIPTLWQKLDTDQICRRQGTFYENAIQLQTNIVDELDKECILISGQLDYCGFQGISEQEQRLLDDRIGELNQSYRYEKAKLSELFNNAHEYMLQVSHYCENHFEEIQKMHTYWNLMFGAYRKIMVGNPVKVKEDVVKDHPDIMPDNIFHKTKYDRFLLLEERLRQDGYLSETQHWVIKHKNGHRDIRSLVIFIVGLLDNGYFLPNKDSLIRSFFESRYQLSIGQNFEPRRRQSFQDKYRLVYIDYPF